MESITGGIKVIVIFLIYILILKYLLRMGFVVFFQVYINTRKIARFTAKMTVFDVKGEILAKFLRQVLR